MWIIQFELKGHVWGFACESLREVVAYTEEVFFDRVILSYVDKNIEGSSYQSIVVK